MRKIPSNVRNAMLKMVIDISITNNIILKISMHFFQFLKMLHPAWFFCNFDRKIGQEIFVKTEKTEYLSNQLTYAHFDKKFIFLIKFWTSEQIFIFWISKVSQISGSPTVNQFL